MEGGCRGGGRTPPLRRCGGSQGQACHGATGGACAHVQGGHGATAPGPRSHERRRAPTRPHSRGVRGPTPRCLTAQLREQLATLRPVAASTAGRRDHCAGGARRPTTRAGRGSRGTGRPTHQGFQQAAAGGHSLQQGRPEGVGWHDAGAADDVGRSHRPTAQLLHRHGLHGAVCIVFVVGVVPVGL